MSQYKRVLLKLSGESLGDSYVKGFSLPHIEMYINAIKAALVQGVQIALVIGGGNIIRGARSNIPFLNQETGDYMGMLATMINGLALRDAFVAADVPVALYGVWAETPAMPMINTEAAHQALNEGKVVICAGGTGNPFVTTDTTASLRAVELHCDIVLKATKVDGVYSADPAQDPAAVRYETLTFDEVLHQDLKVMDLGAFAQCRDHNIAIRIFNGLKPDTLRRALLGEPEGTLVAN